MSRDTERRWWVLYAVAAATFVPALGFHYVGEEGIYTISSLEMWQRGEYVQQLLYGATLQRNPLFNWMIIPLSSLAGWEHVLAAARAVTILATVGTGLVLAWLCHALYRDGVLAAFAAVVYLTLADVFLYRGWLALTDPLFAFFVFAAIAALWIACLRASHALLAVALAAVSCAFLTKTLTAYVFYGVAAAVLFLSDGRYRAFLRGAPSWLMHFVAAALPLLWLYLLPRNVGQGGRLFNEILAKLGPESPVDYAMKLVIYPLETALRLSPALAIAAWFWWRGRAQPRGGDQHVRIALAIALVNFVPYWLAPQSASRYLMPIYPLAALAIARVLWASWAQAAPVAWRWLVALVVLKLAFVLALFPHYQRTYRGENYATVARQIHERVGSHPLYANNSTASGLSVTAHLDILRLPAPALTWPPGEWSSGFVLNYTPDAKLGEVAAAYRMGGNELFLLCRGAACAAK